MTFEQWDVLKPYFIRDEFTCPCCDKEEMNYSFMLNILSIRKECNFPFTITSAYRCLDHEKSQNRDSINGSHPRGEACDVNVWGEKAHTLLGIALEYGIRGIGIYQKEVNYHERFIHLDINTSKIKYRPTIWTY
ncbi:MAG: D-Ala-D-Ala carboxypeptidase family metallohydrolase [Saprospiraceae bacterium]